MPAIPNVAVGQRITASKQNELIDQVNQNTLDIENLSVPGGDLEFVQELIDTAVESHVDAAEPHPAYDDLPSFALLFENGLI